MDGKKGLTDIAAGVRHVLADDPHANDEIRRGRAAFFAEVERRNLPSRGRASARRHRYWLPLGFAASLAAGAAGVWLWTRAGTFQIGESHEGRIGDVVEAVDGTVVPVAFSEGSKLELREGGRIRVLSLEAGATHVLVEEGIVDAAIAHRTTGRTKWEFDAGAYHVTVNGTKFRMAYQSVSRSLRVSTQEGKVTVTGGALTAPRVVAAGESFSNDASQTPGTVDQKPQRAAASSGAAVAIGGSAAVASAAPEPTPGAKVSRGEPWQALLATGQLREGLRAAERADFNLVCDTATLKELLALAEAGRFFGPPARAVAALSAVRRRFPRSPDAGTAAFTLGRIAAEQEGAYTKAAGWFETYLREQPNGPLMGDAFGRLMEARLRSGDRSGARVSAEQYLRRFPAGPYANQAKAILVK